MKLGKSHAILLFSGQTIALQTYTHRERHIEKEQNIHIHRIRMLKSP